MPVTENEQKARERLKRSILALAWTTAGAAAYFLSVFATNILVFELIQALHLGRTAALLGMIFGTLIGLAIGMGISFAYAPILIKRTTDNHPLEPGNHRERIEAAFQGARLRIPDVRVLVAVDPTEERSHANAFIAGLGWGWGWFRPTLFITQSLLKLCGPEELEAVVFHEVSHLSLSHLRKRWAYSALLITGLLAGCVAVLTFLIGAFPHSPMRQFAFVLPMGSFILALREIRRQMMEQEIEADRCAVTRFGISPGTLISALTKIEKWNTIQITPAFYGNHPPISVRVFALELLAKQLPETEIRKPAA